MARLFPNIVSSLAGILFSIIMPAQSLPSLPADSKIERGTLRCGTAYYIVKNDEAQGYADIAVVRRGEGPLDLNKELLGTAFFARHGVGPRPSGFFREQEGSSIIHWDHLPVYKPVVLDSALLATFSLVAASKADQAVIVAGDIDPVELKKRLDIFSILVPSHPPVTRHAPDYVWEPAVCPTLIMEADPSRQEASVRIAYASPRTRYELMNTAQSLVMGILSREFQTVAAHRIARNLRLSKIPYASLRTHYTNSADTGGDEEFSFTVQTDSAHLDDVMRVMSGTLAAIDGFGVPVEEFQDVKKVLMAQMVRRGERPLTNRQYAERCAAHFLYGANLAPYREETRLFARKNLADTTETRLFNDFASALLSQLTNLTLELRSPADSLDDNQALFDYNLAYLYGSVIEEPQDYTWRWRDTLGLESTPLRVRIKTTKAEPVSGGESWIFSNGMRVIYKQIPGSGIFDYALLLPAGLASVPGLQPGEGGYIADMLQLYDVGGIPADRFLDYLAVNGIEMKPDVRATRTVLQGTAPKQKLPTLLKCLQGLANQRSLSPRAFDAFARNAALQGETVEDRLFSEIEPGYALSLRRTPSALSESTQVKAEHLFEACFSRMNQSTLVLCGDLEDAVVKRLLTRTLGAFRTEKSLAPRRAVRLPARTGTHLLSGTDVPGIHLLMDTEYPLTAANYFSAGIVQEIFRKQIVSSLEGSGFSAQVTCRFLSYPQERFRVLVTCTPVPQRGRSEDMPVPNALQAIAAVREGIRQAARTPIPEKDLTAYKAGALQEAKRDLTESSTIVSAVVTRYGVGKDLVTRYTENINTLTSDKLLKMLKAVADGPRVEYIVP
jgi:predicted Zn-dependent peptidase